MRLIAPASERLLSDIPPPVAAGARAGDAGGARLCARPGHSRARQRARLRYSAARGRSPASPARRIGPGGLPSRHIHPGGGLPRQASAAADPAFSPDSRFDLAKACHAHCQDCYLAGSLAGPPITRDRANVGEMLDGLGAYLGLGAVTSTSAERAGKGTSLEASCFTDPLGVEHLIGSLSETMRVFGG